MNDRELLELAAKAHGSLRYIEGLGHIHILRSDRNGAWWNPLENDGDALRLMFKLHLVCDDDSINDCYAACLENSIVDFRRSIVLAAAKIGEEMQ